MSRTSAEGAEQVARMRAKNLLRLDWRDLLKVLGNPPDPDEAKTLDDYFRRFLPPAHPNLNCADCGMVRGGFAAALLGGDRWGIVHGEAFCSRCGWPSRRYHRDVGSIIEFFDFPLQYHPDEIEART